MKSKKSLEKIRMANAAKKKNDDVDPENGYIENKLENENK